MEKALYGLATAAKLWYDLVDVIMMKNGFKRLVTDPCVYVSPKRSIVALIYVDDFLIMAKDSSLAENIEKQIAKRVQVKLIVCLKKFLGIRINFVCDRLELDQTEYVKCVL